MLRPDPTINPNSPVYIPQADMELKRKQFKEEIYKKDVAEILKILERLENEQKESKSKLL